MLNFWKFTSYGSLKPLWSGMGEVVPARTSPTIHPPFPLTVHQLSRLALWQGCQTHESRQTTAHTLWIHSYTYASLDDWIFFFIHFLPQQTDSMDGIEKGYVLEYIRNIIIYRVFSESFLFMLCVQNKNVMKHTKLLHFFFKLCDINKS